jgi:two-component system chemotaxis response regulator CheY
VRVLIVDDSTAMRKIVAHGLRTEGIEAEMLEAADGVDALEVYEVTPLDLIIADRNMPAMGGLELVRAIRLLERTEPQRGYVPIIMVTTEAGEDRVQEAHMVGIDAYLTKPFTPPDLAARVAEVTPYHRAPTPTQGEAPVGEGPADD